MPDKVATPASCRTATARLRRSGNTRTAPADARSRGASSPATRGYPRSKATTSGRISATEGSTPSIRAGPSARSRSSITVQEPTSFGTDASDRLSTSPPLMALCHRIDPRLMLTRRTFLGRMLAGAAVLGGIRAPGSRASTTVLRQLSVRNAAKSFVGDRRLFATISPRSGTGRSGAILDLIADKPVAATLEVVNRNGVGATVVARQEAPLVAGGNQISWTPGPSLKPGSYILRLRDLSTTPAPVLGSAVVRVIDVEATFRQRSALPGASVSLRVQTDAPWLRLTLLQCGPEEGPTNSNYEMRGIPVGTPQRIDLSGRRGLVTTVPVTLDVTASGLYAARLEGPSGHLGFAPIIVRPAAPFAARGDRAADDDLAGLQLLRQERRRIRRHVVLAVLPEAHRPGPPAPSPRRARAVSGATRSSSSTGSLHAATSSTRTATRTSSCSPPPRLPGRLRPDRLPGPYGVRHASGCTTSRAATATSAAG